MTLSILKLSTVVLCCSIAQAVNAFGAGIAFPISSAMDQVNSAYLELLRPLLSNSLMKNVYANSEVSIDFSTDLYLRNMTANLMAPHVLSTSLAQLEAKNLTVTIASDQRVVSISKSRYLSEGSTVSEATTAATNPPFKCVTFPKEYSPFSFCSGVVDYPFVLWNNVTMQDLEAIARAGTTFLNPFLGSPCLSDIKKLICANVYLECVPNGK